MAYYTRRGVLRGATALGFASGTGLLAAMTEAGAANTTGYKALVCVFLYGGLDGADAVLPLDTESYNALRSARQDLFNIYGNSSNSRSRSDLLALTGINTGDGRQFGLAPELAPLQQLYNQRRLAVVGNVGPLVEPTTRTTMENASAALPDRLFSHNDQQAVWMTGGLEGRRLGWGGEFADAVAPVSGMARTFTSVTAASPDAFLRGSRTAQYAGRKEGPVKLSVAVDTWRLGNKNDEARRILADHYASKSDVSDNVLMRDLIAANRRTQADNATFKEAIDGASPLTTVFPNTKLGQQLATVATTISIRGAFGVNRQMFYAAIGGFDSHDSQANDVPNLLRELGDAVAAFDAAMQELGLGDQVTLFTASDFGRTLIGNGTGTDHGWGSHHFVVGGAVQGRALYGEIPPIDFADEQYTESRGRLIPTTSVDQYAASLGKWFGLTNAELRNALPNLGNFGTAPDMFGLGSNV